MLGYQTTDGVPITLNEWLLTDVLKNEWGYQGALVTDWDNVGRMVWEQRVQPDYAHAAAAATKAGNDMIMTTPGFYEGALEAVEAGMLPADAFDDAVARILTIKFDLGLFEDPRLPVVGHEAIVGQAAHTELNLETARRSIVLLENDGTLPLGVDAEADGAATRPLKLAVVGPLADDAQYQLGDWAGGSGQAGWIDGQPRELITTVLDGLRELAPAGSEVSYARGADILTLEPHPLGATHPDGQPRPPVVRACPPDEALIAQAVADAENADAVVAVVGDAIELVGEGRSTATLELIGGQIALLNAVIATGKPVIVVLLASKPLVLPPSVEQAAAVIWVANPGMQGGRALAEIVLGRTEPSGRLPISFARHVGQQPTYYNQLRGQHGDRYADLTQSPAWAFGEGLTYSTVEYSGLTLAETSLGVDDTIVAEVTVANTGARPVRETVQLYVRDDVTSASWADRELKAYRQVLLAAGESQRVRIELPVAACTIVDAAARRIVEPGEFDVLVGPSSREEALLVARFTVR
jgi:beta-glucosidase